MLLLACEAMRTRFEVALADEGQRTEGLRAAGEAALNEIAEVEARLSPYRTDSDLYAVNASAADRPVRVEARTLSFLQEARRLTQSTDGAFDLTVGPLVQMWSHHGDSEQGGTVPEEQALQEVLTRVGMESNVLLDEHETTVRFTQPGVSLHPGAIGKGYALDRAVTLLREETGVRRALLHGGTSTVCALGEPTDTPEGWRVAIGHPQQAGKMLATALLRDGLSLSVSAVHGRTFYAAGKRFGHVLDPRTGLPVEKNLLAAVVAPSATETDALSTALLVLGEGGLSLLSARFAQAAGYLLVSEEPERQGSLRVTALGKVWRDIPSGTEG